VGSLCYKPIFASDASTVSPLFRILDSLRGTLVIDEGDFRLSDERAEIVKILNNGNAKGFPVLRSEATGNRGEFNPGAYEVYGPKLIATRSYFEDRALESRRLTEETGGRALRDDIPISLPPEHKEEALRLRNKLLLFRFRNLRGQKPGEGMPDRTIEPRLNQIFLPLLAVVRNPKDREELRVLARRYHGEMVSERRMDLEAQILEVIRDLRESGRPLAVKDITSWLADRHGDEYERKITTKWIGNIIRRKLRLRPVRTSSGYVIPPAELPKVDRLYERYGVLSGTGETEPTPATQEPISRERCLRCPDRLHNAAQQNQCPKKLGNPQIPVLHTPLPTYTTFISNPGQWRTFGIRRNIRCSRSPKLRQPSRFHRGADKRRSRAGSGRASGRCQPSSARRFLV